MTRQKRLPKEQRMQLIRNHAKDVFLRKGFENTIMDDVIEESNMSTGGVYRHYRSTTEMLYDLMIDANEYRKNLIEEYLNQPSNKDKYHKMAEILINKALASTELMTVYVIFLKAKNQHKELEELYQKLKAYAIKQLGEVAKKLGIETDIFEDEFLVNYINSLTLGAEVLNGREELERERNFLIETVANYISALDKERAPVEGQ